VNWRTERQKNASMRRLVFNMVLTKVQYPSDILLLMLIFYRRYLLFIYLQFILIFLINLTSKQSGKKNAKNRKIYDVLLEHKLVERDDTKFPPHGPDSDESSDEDSDPEADVPETGQLEQSQDTGSARKRKRTDEVSEKRDINTSEPGYVEPPSEVKDKVELAEGEGKNEITPLSDLQNFAAHISAIDYKDITKNDLNTLWKQGVAIYANDKVSFSPFLRCFFLCLSFLF
jgi:hypothetical protein